MPSKPRRGYLPVCLAVICILLLVAGFWSLRSFSFLDGFWFGAPRPFHTVVIDPGHGGNDPGAIALGIMEKDLTRALAGLLAEELATLGIRSHLTRSTDSYVSLPARVAEGNRKQRSIFVSLHFNHSESTSASGIETFFHDERKPFVTEPGLPPPPASFLEPRDSEILAGFVQYRLTRATGATDRGIKNADFHVLRNSHRPSVLIEGGFLTHPMEHSLLGNSGYLRVLARAIAAGIGDFRLYTAGPVASAGTRD